VRNNFAASYRDRAIWRRTIFSNLTTSNMRPIRLISMPARYGSTSREAIMEVEAKNKATAESEYSPSVAQTSEAESEGDHRYDQQPEAAMAEEGGEDDGYSAAVDPR